MAASSRRISFASRVCEYAATLIGAGLLVLAIATCWPQVPAVTGMALVALGAIGATIARFRTSPALVLISLLNVALYGGLYAMFVGATLHASTRSETGIGLLTAIDLAVSIWPIAAALMLLGDILSDTAAAE